MCLVVIAGGCTDRASRPAESTGSNAAGATAVPANAANGATGSPTSVSPASRRVIILGTSLTAGLGLSPELAYPSLLQRKADSAGFRIEVINAGLSGETSAGALRRIEWVLDQPAAAVVLEVGANDGLRGVNPDSTYANMVTLIRETKRLRPDARVVLVQMEAPTNLGQNYTSRFHDAYVRAAKSEDIPLLPFLLEGVAGDARFNQGDGIHPNAAGAERVAETMWRALLPLLSEIAAR